MLVGFFVSQKHLKLQVLSWGNSPTKLWKVWIKLIQIAVAGKIRSGKNTVAAYLGKKLDCHQIAFADGISQVIIEYFNDAFKEGKPRKHYQIIGQAFRQLNPNIWVQMLDAEMDYYKEDNENVIVTDLRQPNEYEYLKNEGFIIVKVEADFEIRVERSLASGDKFDTEDFYHETELNIDAMDYDYLVSNNTTLEDLLDQLDYVIAEIKGDAKWRDSISTNKLTD